MAPPSICNDSNVVELIRPFDPLSFDAEERYDAVVLRVNHLRLRRVEVGRELAELKRQFVDNDLTTEADRDGSPCQSKEARRQRLHRMLELSGLFDRLGDEEEFAVANLDRMNDALDRWARETYGV